MKGGAGYIAIDRGIFDHPALRKPQRFLAWQWLIAQAAWKVEGRRGTWGVVHVERGEVAASTRTLAQAWRWPQSNVRCFLDRLVRDGMITVTKTRSATRSEDGPKLEHDVSIIKVCNYDKFQNPSTSAKSKPAQRPAQGSASHGAQTAMFPGFVDPLTNQPFNQNKQEKDFGIVGEVRDASRPKWRHEAQSKHGNIFIHYGTAEWRMYADDFRETLGVEPMPKDGGYWFYKLGEAARPANQRAWNRRRSLYGAAARPLPKPLTDEKESA